MTFFLYWFDILLSKTYSQGISEQVKILHTVFQKLLNHFKSNFPSFPLCSPSPGISCSQHKDTLPDYQYPGKESGTVLQVWEEDCSSCLSLSLSLFFLCSPCSWLIEEDNSPHQRGQRTLLRKRRKSDTYWQPESLLPDEK